MTVEKSEEEKTRGVMSKKIDVLRVFSFFVPFLKRARVLLLPVLFFLGIPQLFVISYYFPSLITRYKPLVFFRAVLRCGFMAAWVSFPLLAAFYFLGRLAMRRKVHAGIILLSGVVAGYLWVVCWNMMIDLSFGYFRAMIPVLLCVLASAGGPLVHRAYRRFFPAE